MDKLLERLLAALMMVVLAVAAWAGFGAPAPARADDEFALDRGGTERRSGDPLDTNDADGDDGGGAEIHDPLGMDAGGSFFDRFLGTSRVLLIPQYDGHTLVFRIIHLSDSMPVAEGKYAK